MPESRPSNYKLLIGVEHCIMICCHYSQSVYYSGGKIKSKQFISIKTTL